MVLSISSVCSDKREVPDTPEEIMELVKTTGSSFMIGMLNSRQTSKRLIGLHIPKLNLGLASTRSNAIDLI